MNHSARFALPFIAPGQLQKEWTHNEALQRIDALLCPAVEGPALSTPPATPMIGVCYIVGPAATEAWSGHDGALACFTDGGWKFIAPIEGMQLIDRISGQPVLRRAGAWETGVVRAQEVQVAGQVVVRSRQAAIGDPTGGGVVDAEARTAIASILAALRAHGLIA